MFSAYSNITFTVTSVLVLKYYIIVFMVWKYLCEKLEIRDKRCVRLFGFYSSLAAHGLCCSNEVQLPKLLFASHQMRCPIMDTVALRTVDSSKVNNGCHLQYGRAKLETRPLDKPGQWAWLPRWGNVIFAGNICKWLNYQ